MLMLPDENREALLTLLTFLSHIASNAKQNQVSKSTVKQYNKEIHKITIYIAIASKM